MARNLGAAMPTETRRITFSSHELVEAIAHFAKATKYPMPPGKVTGCQIDQHGAVSATLTIQHMAEGSTRTARFDNNSIAAALILYCIEKKIPIPKAAVKSVQSDGKYMALILRIGEAAEGAAA